MQLLQITTSTKANTCTHKWVHHKLLGDFATEEQRYLHASEAVGLYDLPEPSCAAHSSCSSQAGLKSVFPPAGTWCASARLLSRMAPP